MKIRLFFLIYILERRIWKITHFGEMASSGCPDVTYWVNFMGDFFHLVSKIVSKGWLEKLVTLRKWYLRVGQVLNTLHTFHLVLNRAILLLKDLFEKWPTLVKWYLLGVQVLSFPPNPISICHCTDRGRYKGWTQTIICEGFFTQISRKQHICKNVCKVFMFLSPKPF